MTKDLLEIALDALIAADLTGLSNILFERKKNSRSVWLWVKKGIKVIFINNSTFSASFLVFRRLKISLSL